MRLRLLFLFLLWCLDLATIFQNNAVTKSLDNEIEERIFELVKSTGSITRKMLENALGLKQTKAGLLLKQMESKDLLKKAGSGKNTRYYKIN